MASRTSTSPARTPMWQPVQLAEPTRPRAVARRSCGIRIGDPDETISAPHCDLRDLLRRHAARCAPSTATTSSTGTPPDSTGNPRSSDVKITATVPGGAQERQLLRRPAAAARRRCETADYAEAAWPPSASNMCRRERASPSASRSSPVWWRTTSRTWNRTAPS